MRLMKQEVNELKPEFLSTLAVDPFKANNSASRSQMLANHLGQRLTVDGGEERYINTGSEDEFGKGTFSVKMPHDGHVIAVIDRYEYSHTADNIAITPEYIPQSIVIYERADTKEVGYINLTKYSSQHQYFGFKYKSGPAMSKRSPGMAIREGEVFQDSPSINAHGGYEMAPHLLVAYLSHPAVAEDGILISESAARKYGYYTWETRVVEFGSKKVPVNSYGTAEQFKAFPDIGEFVREDGLLMATREFNEDYSIVEQSVQDMMELDPFFDDTTYVTGGGKVIDIKVHHQRGNQQPCTPDAMEAQVLKYDRGRRRFYDEILRVYNGLKRQRGVDLNVTPQFTALVREAISVVGFHSGHQHDPIRLLYRQAPIDEWRVEFVIEHHHIPKDGAKLTDFHGGKGVICQIVPDEWMPVDAHGVRAEAIMDGLATNNRMNYGRLYEHFFNACSRCLVRELTLKLGVDPESRELWKQLASIEANQPEQIDQVWARLMRYYEILSPRQHAMFATGKYRQPRLRHLEIIIRNRMLHIDYPSDNPPEPTNQVRLLMAEFPPLYGPVTYTGNSGIQRTTHFPVLIGHVYVMLLEKVADDWSALSSGKLQHHGVLAQITASDKYAKPSRNTPVRAMGESEVRIYASYCGPKITTDMMDRNNNPFTHKHMVENILNAEKPTAIERIVDRSVVPLGGSKPLQLVKHIAETGGWRFVYERPLPTVPTQSVPA